MAIALSESAPANGRNGRRCGPALRSFGVFVLFMAAGALSAMAFGASA